MKILNLYAGIGGNRKLWGNEHEITAVEYNPEIAKIYSDFFPNDKMVVGDAHQYLLDHYAKFDFVWSSPPCQTHTRMNVANQLSPYKDNTKQLENGGAIKPRYPDMKLYQEIIFLKTFYKGQWVVENVIGYYEPLIAPQLIGRHYIWSNFLIPPMESITQGFYQAGVTKLQEMHQFDLSKYKLKHRKDQILKNCVEGRVGLHILNYAINPIKLQKELTF